MLAVVVVLFLVCWGPTLTDNVLTALGVVEQTHDVTLKTMRQIFHLMSYFNR